MAPSWLQYNISQKIMDGALGRLTDLFHFVFLVFRIRFQQNTFCFCLCVPILPSEPIGSEYTAHAFYSTIKVIIDDALRCSIVYGTHTKIFHAVELSRGRRKILHTTYYYYHHRRYFHLAFLFNSLLAFCLFFIIRLCVNKGDLCICNKSS